MLDIIKSIVYGVVQGITEWLPISSTGHLILAEQFLSFENVSEGFFNMFDVVIQFGSIQAVVVLFWNKVWPFYNKKKESKSELVKSEKDPVLFGGFALSMDAFWMWVKIVVACLPAVVYGLLFDDAVSELFEKTLPGTEITIQVVVVAVMLILVGVLFTCTQKIIVKYILKNFGSLLSCRMEDKRNSTESRYCRISFSTSCRWFFDTILCIL